MSSCLPRILIFAFIGSNLLFLTFLSGCSFHQDPSGDLFEQSILRSRHLRTRYGEIRDPQLASYGHYLCWRLARAFERVERGVLPASQCEIVILGSSAPLAFSLGLGRVAISKGLVLRMRNEAELAFVLAHEISHDHLGHEAEIYSVGDYLLEQERQVGLELDADRFALGLIALAGYDPRASLGAIMSASGIHGSRRTDGTGTHPSVEHRYQIAWKHLEKSKWEPPGTIDKREFKKIKSLLQGS